MIPVYVHDPRKAVAAAMTLLDQKNEDLAAALSQSTGKRWTKNMVASLVRRRRKLDTPFAGHVKVDTTMRYTRVRGQRMVETMMEGLDYFDDSQDEPTDDEPTG